MLEKIDDSLLMFFENICHFIQKTSGIDNFNVAKIFIVVMTFLFIINDTGLFLYIWSLFFCFYLLWLIKDTQSKYYKSIFENEITNPAKYDPNKKNSRSFSIIINFLCLIYVRFINLSINDYAAFKIFATFFSGSIVDYLCACTPAQPNKKIELSVIDGR